jgi:Holliday junction resolvase RusA-like endonuclease
MGKARPRVTKRGTFMPKAYDLWRNMFKLHVRNQVHSSFLHLLPLTGRLSFSCEFSSPTGNIRPDLDNSCGAIWDAIQVPKKGGWGLIQDDKQFMLIVAQIVQGPAMITFEIEELTNQP